MRWLAGIARWSGAALGVLLSAIGLLLLGTYLALQLDSGRTWLAGVVTSHLSRPDGTGIRIGEIRGDLLRVLEFRHMAAQDPRGEWLRLAEARLRWRPMALLAGELHIVQADLRGLRLARLPEAGASEAGEPRRARVPLTFAMERFELHDAHLASPVLGAPASVRAAGDSRLDAAGTLLTNVRMERSDGVAGHGELRAAWYPVSRRLDLRATVEEPAGGMVARAARLPSSLPLFAELSGDGPLDDWQGRLSVRTGAVASVEADISLQGPPPLRLIARGRAALAGLVDEPAATWLADPPAFDVALGLGQAEGIRLERLHVVNELARLELDGRMAAEGTELAGRVTLTAEGTAALGALAAPLSIAELHAETALSGSLDRLLVDVQLHAGDLGIEGLTARRARGRFRLAFDEGLRVWDQPLRIDGEGRLDGITAPDARSQVLLEQGVAWRVSTTVDPGARTAEFTRAELSAPGLSLSASGRVAMDAAADLRISARVHDLALLGPVADRALRGSMTANGWLRRSSPEGGLSAGLEAELLEPGVGDLPLGELLGPRVSLAGRLDLDGAGHAHVRELKVAGRAVHLDGSLRVIRDPDAVEGQYRLVVSDLAALSPILGPPLAGSGRVAGTLGGSLSAPALEGEFALASLRAGAGDLADMGDLEGRFAVTRIGREANGRVSVERKPGSRVPFHASSRFTLRSTGHLELAAMSVETRGSRLHGNLRVPPDGGPLQGGVSGNIDSLGEWSSLIGHEVSGSLTFHVQLDGDGAGQGATIVARAADARLKAASLGTTEFSELALSANLADVRRLPRGNIGLEALGVRVGEARLASLSVNAEVAGGTRADLALQGEGSFRGPLAVAAAATLSRGDDGLQVQLRQLEARALGHRLAAERPGRLLASGRELRIDDLEWRIDDGSVSLQGVVSEASVEARLQARNLPLEMLELVRPDTRLRGALSGQAKLAGARSAPSGDFQLSLVDVRRVRDVLQELPPVSMSARGELRDGRLDMDGELAGISQETLAFDASIPVALHPGSWRVVLPPRGRLAGRAVWRGEMRPLWELASDSEDLFSGKGDLALELGGTVGSPRLQGRFQLSDGTYENVTSGTVVQGIELVLEGNDRRLVLTRASAGDGGKGRLRAEGGIDLARVDRPVMDLRIHLDQFLLVERDELMARASGDLGFSGPMSELVAGGRVVIDEGDVNLAQSPPVQVVELQVTEVDAVDSGAGPSPPRRPEAGADFGLALEIQVPGRFFVRGPGLESEWAGSLRVSGSVESPVVEGVLRPVRGRYSLAGKAFELTSGAVRFAGTEEIDPLIDLSAEHRASGLTALITVTGRASAPVISLSSQPPLPPADIASRVLFDKSTDQLTAGQALQVASAVATLTGAGGSGGLLNRTRRLLRVDHIGVAESRSGNGETVVSVGKYLADGVYVEVEQGAGEGTGAASVELEVIPNVRVGTGVRETGANEFGVTWRWDY